MGKRRLIVEGARYHVVARTEGGEPRFEAREAVELVCLALVEARTRYDFSLEGFCVFEDRLDLFISPGEGEELSAIMRWLLGTIAARYNRLRGLSGHLWGRRYASRIYGREARSRLST